MPVFATSVIFGVFAVPAISGNFRHLPVEFTGWTILVPTLNSNHAKFIEMTHYLSHFVFWCRHFAVLMISEETRENCKKIVTYLSFHR